MNSLIEEALKLPKEEKVKLYYALQEDLEFDDDILAEDELTLEQWKELDKRVKDAESGKAEFISMEDFKKKLGKKINKI